MVDALREARRVLTNRGVLIDVRPVIAPVVVEVIAAARTIWAQEVEVYSEPEDIAAASAAVRHALSNHWFVSDRSRHFDFEIFCDTAAELRSYLEARKLRGAEIPYEEIEERRRDLTADGRTSRLRCIRRWMLSKYDRK